MTYPIALIIAVILLVPGVAFSVIPAVPGIVYMLFISFLFGIYDHFLHLTWIDLSILTLIAIITMLVDFFAGMIGAKWGGAHWSSIISGLAGLILGSIFIPVPFFGSLIGLFLGVLISEWYRTRDGRKANRAAVGSFLGSIAGTGFKIAASVVFLAAFVILAIV